MTIQPRATLTVEDVALPHQNNRATATAANAFGVAVALSSDGTMLAVGANGESSDATGIGGNQADNSAPGAGAVYVFAAQ